jgi:hypothetical protein
MKKQKPKQQVICGDFKQIHYDDLYDELDLELVQTNLDLIPPCYEIHIAGKIKDKWHLILKLHLKEAIELKSMIDNLVVDAMENNSLKETFDRSDLKFDSEKAAREFNAELEKLRKRINNL